MRTAALAAACMAGVFGTAALSGAAIDREQQRFEGTAVATPRPATFSPVAYRMLKTRGALPSVVAAVESAQRGDPIPSGLTPPIGQLRNFSAPYMPADGCIARDRTSGTTSRVCRVGRPSSRKLVVLIGDSHALMWLPPLLELAWHDNWAVVPLIRLGCTPGRWLNKSTTGCQAWYRWALQQAARLHPQVTLIGGSIDQRDTPETRAAINGVLSTAGTLKASSRVVVIGDPEGLTEDPVDCLLASRASMATCTTTWPSSALAPYDSVARGARALDVAFLPTRGFLCFDRRCPTVIGNTIAWMDTDHMTVAYSVQIAGAFRAAFLDATRRRS